MSKKIAETAETAPETAERAERAFETSQDKAPYSQVEKHLSLYELTVESTEPKMLIRLNSRKAALDIRGQLLAQGVTTTLRLVKYI